MELFSAEEAADLELRSQLLIAIWEFTRKRELNQAELAEMLRVWQARVSNLRNIPAALSMTSSPIQIQILCCYR